MVLLVDPSSLVAVTVYVPWLLGVVLCMYSEPFCSSGSLTGDPFLVQLISGGGLPRASTYNVVGCPTDVFTSGSLMLTTGTGNEQYIYSTKFNYLSCSAMTKTVALLKVKVMQALHTMPTDIL